MNTNNIFKKAKTIAVVGLSDKKDRYSYQVASYLQSKGYRIVPVNPNITEVLGEKSYPNILSVPKDIHIDVIDLFRRSDLVMPHVKEAVTRGDVQAVWMQEGVSDKDAAQYAEENGLSVIMNMCMMVAHKTKREPTISPK